MLMSKKVAFIGCSHFAVFEQSGQGHDSWTWQLSQKFPQHYYRNYSIGGRGLDFFQWCLMDAVNWGADIVFLNKTHRGRWAMLGMFNEASPTEMSWIEHKHSSNWSECYLQTHYIWGSRGDAHYSFRGIGKDALADGDSDGYLVDSYLEKQLTITTDTITNVSILNDLRNNYEDYWYRIAPKLYNFDNLFIVHWEADDDDDEILSNIRTDITVIQLLCNIVKCDHWQELFPHGITLAKNDPHLSSKGHKIILEQYILHSKEVRNSLMSN